MKIHTLKESSGCIRPNDIKGWYFPNWFGKEHFEMFLDRKLTDKQFQLLKDDMEDSLCDEISGVISNYLNVYADEILKEGEVI